MKGEADHTDQGRMGHTTIQVTPGTYSSLFPSLEEALTDALDDVYRTAEPTRAAAVRGLAH